MGYFRHQYEPITWDVCGMTKSYDKCNPKSYVGLHKILGGDSKVEDKEFVVATIHGRHHQQELFHNITFSFRTKKNKNGFYEKAEGDEFEINDSFSEELFDDVNQLEEKAKKKLNSSTIYVSNTWEDFVLDSKGLIWDPSKINTTKNNPFRVFYSETDYTNDDSIPCVDNGLVIEYKGFEVKTIIHTELKYGWSKEDVRWHGEERYKNYPKQWWRYKYYFVTIKNNDTGTVKKTSYLKLEAEHCDEFAFERYIYG